MAYQSDIDKAVASLKRKLELAANLPLEAIAMGLVADNSHRIHNQGKDVKGNNIGTYDTTNELYVNPENSPGKTFQPMGKNGINPNKQVFSVKTKKASKTISSHRTKWFPNYKAYKNTVKPPADKVNLFLSGKLSKEFQYVKLGNNAYSIGFLTAYGTKVAAGQEKRFNKKIWGITKENERQIAETIYNHINEIFD